MSSEKDDKIYLHFAKCIINEDAYIYNNDVLNVIDVDSIVRISYVVDYSPIESWNHDAPFLKIVKKNDSEFLGIILDKNRIKNTNKYLLNIGEKVWLHKDNIIEILTDVRSERFLTSDKVQCTGPLFTIESDSDSDSDSNSDSSECSSVSDSD